MTGGPARSPVAGTLVVAGTGTGIGKTVASAAVATLALRAGRRVAMLKPAQTGVTEDEPGDTAEAKRLAGPVTVRELRRYPDPLAPATAARRAGTPCVTLAEISAEAGQLATSHDLVLIEGAGGLLVWFDDDGTTIADVAAALHVPVLLVTEAVLGTLSTTALAAEALRSRGVDCLGLIVGAWPAQPGLAARCNLTDLPRVTGLPLLGALPEGMGALAPETFHTAAGAGLGPVLGGQLDAARFAADVSEPWQLPSPAPEPPG